MTASLRRGAPPPPAAERDDPDLAAVGELVARARAGDAEAFGELYERAVGTIYRYVYVRVGGHAQLAEDLTSETFLRALRRLDTFEFRGSDITAWLVTIARNLVTDHARSARQRLEVTVPDHRPEALVSPDAAEEHVLRQDRAMELLAEVRRLTPDQADCLTLRFLLGLSLSETAQVLGRSEGAVKQLQLRGLSQLRRRLPPGCGDPDVRDIT